MKYLIIECEPLMDQFECDANRVPLCIVNNYDNYKVWGYEVYEIKENGSLECIQEYEDCERVFNPHDPFFYDEVFEMVEDYFMKKDNLTRHEAEEKICRDFTEKETIDFFIKNVWGK